MMILKNDTFDGNISKTDQQFYKIMTYILIVAAFLVLCGLCVALSCRNALVVDDDYEEDSGDERRNENGVETLEEKGTVQESEKGGDSCAES